MKTLKVVGLCIIMLSLGGGLGWRLSVSFHRPQFEHHGWFVSQYHGTYSIYAYGAANEDLEEKVRQITGNPDSRCFAIPSIGNYKLYIYGPRKLSEDEDTMLRKFADDRLSHHEAEYAKAIEKNT